MTDRNSDREPKSVGEALEHLSREIGIDEHRPAVAVHEHWTEVVVEGWGEEVAAHAAPGQLRDGVLTVEVDDPAWATHLRYLGPSLVTSLNEAIGGSVVSEIRIVVTRSGRRADARE